MAKSTNPLQGYLRNPKLYILLPSGGKFSNIESISDVSKELPIYPLTSMDETILRNPDALLNGESMVKVITSCTGIKDVYNLTSNDIDVILLAIRFATYGNELEISSPCPECKHDNNEVLNIETILETITVLEDHYSVTLESGLICDLKPYTFKDAQRAALAAFRETSELNNLINDDTDELARLTSFNKSFLAMAELNIDILSNAVIKVLIPETDESEEVIVKNKKHINEWVRGISKMEADKITAELNIINDLGIERNASITCSAEGCAHEYETKIEYNPSNFFRSQLVTQDKSDVLEYLQGLSSDARAIEKQIFEICWYMRGGISLTEAWQLSYDQRSTIMDIISSNIERTRESGIALM